MSLALKMAANYQPFFLLNQLFIYNFVFFFFCDAHEMEATSQVKQISQEDRHEWGDGM